MKISLELLIRILHCWKFLPQFPRTCDCSFIQLQSHKIKTEFQKILLLFSKFMKRKKYFNFSYIVLNIQYMFLWKYWNL